MAKPFMAHVPGKPRREKTSEGIRLRFTQSDSAVYATLLGTPKIATITLKSTVPKAGTQIYLLGEAEPLVWSQHGSDINVMLPTALPGQYAYVIKMMGHVSIAG